MTSIRHKNGVPDAKDFASEHGEGSPLVLDESSGHLYSIDPSGTVNCCLSKAWPVGSIFISASPANPSALLGFGTWSAFGPGRVLIGKDANDTDFDTLEETGGAKTSAHTHGTGTLAIANHTESASLLLSIGAIKVGSLTHSISGSTASDATSVVQPYIVVNMWKRTA